MADSDMFTRQLADAARSMQGETGTQETLDKAVVIATEIVDGCDLAGISIVHRHLIDTPAGSDESLKRIDELQYELKQGPCLDALRTHETVHSTDLAGDERWPEWGPRVTKEIGVASIVTYRLFTSRDTLGAMNLYSRRPGAFDTEDIYNGQALAAHVAVALAGAQNTEHLETAVTNRTVIGQAEGILMERFDISAEHAFSVLRRVSQQRNVKLSRVAEDLVRSRRTPG